MNKVSSFTIKLRKELNVSCFLQVNVSRTDLNESKNGMTVGHRSPFFEFISLFRVAPVLRLDVELNLYTQVIKIAIASVS